MKVNLESRQHIEKLLDFAHFTIRALELYDSVRSSTTRQLLLAELHQRSRLLNGALEARKFHAHVSLLLRIITEIPASPEHIEAGIECAEQLIQSIDSFLLSEVNENAA